MDGLFTLLLTTSFYATAMAAAAIVIRPLAARLFGYRCMALLWCLILVRLLVPLWLPAPFPWSLSQLLPLWLPDWNPSVEYTVTFCDSPPGLQQTEAVRMASAAVETALPAALPLVWAAGALACCFRLLLSSRATRRLVREAVRLPGDALPFACPVPIYTSDRTKTPLACGTLRPRILLPQGMQYRDAALLRHVVTHELTHIRSGHQWIKSLALAAVCAHWFNPAVWMIPRLIARDLELSCDGQVLKALGGDSRRNYALSLLHLAQAGSCPPTCSGFGMKPIEERLRAILRFSQPSFLQQSAGTLAACAVFLFFSASPPGDASLSYSAYAADVKSSVAVAVSVDVASAPDDAGAAAHAAGEAANTVTETITLYDIQAGPVSSADVSAYWDIKAAQEQAGG